MPRIPINYGSVPGDGTGDIVFTSFEYINTNFVEVYADVAAAQQAATQALADAAAAAAGSGHDIEDALGPVPDQPILKFDGDGVTLSDDGSKTIVTVAGGAAPVASVVGATGAVTLADMGLENVDNVSDANKPVSTAQQTALNSKEDIIGTKNSAFNKPFGTVAGTVCQGNDSRLGVSGGHTIEDEGTPVAQQTNLNFTGAGVSVADSGGKTVVTVAGGAAPVDSVAGATGAVTLTDMGLENVDNVSDANKPVSTAQQTEIDTKEDAIGNPGTDGHVLSSTAAGIRSWVAPGSGGDATYATLVSVANGDGASLIGIETGSVTATDAQAAVEEMALRIPGYRGADKSLAAVSDTIDLDRLAINVALPAGSLGTMTSATFFVNTNIPGGVKAGDKLHMYVAGAGVPRDFTLDETISTDVYLWGAETGDDTFTFYKQNSYTFEWNGASWVLDRQHIVDRYHQQLHSTTYSEGSSLVKIEDLANTFSGDNVETAIVELGWRNASKDYAYALNSEHTPDGTLVYPSNEQQTVTYNADGSVKKYEAVYGGRYWTLEMVEVDSNGNVTTAVATDGSTSWTQTSTYDANNQLTSVSAWVKGQPNYQGSSIYSATKDAATTVAYERMASNVKRIKISSVATASVNIVFNKVPYANTSTPNITTVTIGSTREIRLPSNYDGFIGWFTSSGTATFTLEQGK